MWLSESVRIILIKFQKLPNVVVFGLYLKHPIFLNVFNRAIRCLSVGEG